MIESLNRAFMYGESVFTTMRMVDGNLCDWEYHFERLRRGVEFVYGPFTEGSDWVALFKNRLEASIQNESGDRVIRLTVYRDQVTRGLMRSSLLSISSLKIHPSASPLEIERIEDRLVKLRTCPANIRPHWYPSYLKAGNYLDTILAQKIFLKAEDDDVLFLSREDTICESSVANIFIVRHNKLYTAPAGPNVLEGVMRRKILALASEFFVEVYETDTTLDQAYRADAVFGSNSIRGLFLVNQIDGHDINCPQDLKEKLIGLRNRVMK